VYLKGLDSCYPGGLESCYLEELSPPNVHLAELDSCLPEGAKHVFKRAFELCLCRWVGQLTTVVIAIFIRMYTCQS
jgi:hypothetical protein